MIKGRTRKIPSVPEIKVNLNASIHNRFDIEVIDSVTGEIKQKAQAENVILNRLWTDLATPRTYFTYIAYGTGSGTPAATDTALFTPLSYKNVTNPTYAYDWNNGVCSVRQQCQLLESEHVGSILTEIGIYNPSAQLVTHAMLKDMNGNQISITKTSTDIINIYATVFVHWDPAGFDNGNIRILPGVATFWKYLLGTSVDRILEFVICSSGPPKEYLGASPSFATKVFSAANKTITLTMNRVSATNGNTGHGFSTVFLCSSANTNVGYIGIPFIECLVGGSFYTGTNIVGEAIGTGDGTTKAFSFDFPNVQSGAKIYINGVEQTSGFAITENAPLAITDLGRYFQPISMASYGGARPTGAHYYWDETLNESVWYNPYYAYGVKSFSHRYCTIKVSNDLVNWVTLVGTGVDTTTCVVPVEYRNYKYWKTAVTVLSNYTQTFINTLTTDTLTVNHLNFDTAPASGAVITSDYTTKTIAKDINHVFDFSAVIQLGEYTG